MLCAFVPARFFVDAFGHAHVRGFVCLHAYARVLCEVAWPLTPCLCISQPMGPYDLSSMCPTAAPALPLPPQATR